jgi:hypothetical protein
MTGHGNLSERSTKRELAGVGGSVAGCESVCAGTAVCVVRSRTVREEGVYVTSYEIGALCNLVDANSGCMCSEVGWCGILGSALPASDGCVG